MPAPNHRERTQEQSIKARKHELFEDPTDDHPTLNSVPRRTFAECLRDTPAQPLDPTVRIGLWVVGVLIVVLLLAAFAKVGNRPARIRQTTSLPNLRQPSRAVVAPPFIRPKV